MNLEVMVELGKLYRWCLYALWKKYV